MKFLNKLFFVFLVLSLSSCADDLDFDQVNDFEITPVYKTSLINFELDATELDALNIDSNFTPVDELNISDLTATTNRNLDKVVFEFEASNPFEGDFEIVLDLLDSSNAVIYSFDTITLTEATPDIVLASQTINLRTNPEVYNAREIRGALSYSGSTTANTGALSFESAGTFFFTIK